MSLVNGIIHKSGSQADSDSSTFREAVPVELKFGREVSRLTEMKETFFDLMDCPMGPLKDKTIVAASFLLACLGHFGCLIKLHHPLLSGP